MRQIICATVLILMISCSKQKDYLMESESNLGNEDLRNKSLVINEYSPKSSVLNEFDEEADWIELYNSSENSLEIVEGTWSITDNDNLPEKYFIPACTIPANGHLVIWCDGRDQLERDPHSNFKLSGKGEQISLYFDGNLMDEILFEDDVKKDVSYGRVGDGEEEWIMYRSPSPGTSNQSSDNYAETLK